MCHSSDTTSRLGRNRRVRAANPHDSGATSRLGRKAGAQRLGSGETARRSNPSTCANVGAHPCPKKRFSPKAGSCAEKGPLSAPARPEFSQAGTMCRECRATSRLGRTSRQPVGPPLPRRDDGRLGNSRQFGLGAVLKVRRPNPSLYATLLADPEQAQLPAGKQTRTLRRPRGLGRNKAQDPNGALTPAQPKPDHRNLAVSVYVEKAQPALRQDPQRRSTQRIRLSYLPLSF